VSAAQQLPFGRTGQQPAAHEPAAALDGLDLTEDRFDGPATLDVADLALSLPSLASMAARRLSLVDTEGLPSLRGLPWRPWRAGGISNSGASGIADTLAIDQYPESAARRWTGSQIPALARVVRIAVSIGASC
jgi:hypothetical protein